MRTCAAPGRSVDTRMRSMQQRRRQKPPEWQLCSSASCLMAACPRAFLLEGERGGKEKKGKKRIKKLGANHFCLRAFLVSFFFWRLSNFKKKKNLPPLPICSFVLASVPLGHQDKVHFSINSSFQSQFYDRKAILSLCVLDRAACEHEHVQQKDLSTNRTLYVHQGQKRNTRRIRRSFDW